MRRSVSHRPLWSILAVIAGSGEVSSVQAQGANVAAAEALFRDGKARLAAKDYAHACPKLADSHRLDPATGTLLALAICHEREGKLASAWAEYADAAARAKREARPDREKAAREKAASLESKLSQLTIAAPPAVSETPGIEITRNGIPVGAGTLGTAVPVDGGTYAIEATAPRKKAWRAKVTVAASDDRQTLAVPPLEDDPNAKNEPKPRKLPPIRPGGKSAIRPLTPAAATPPTNGAPSGTTLPDAAHPDRKGPARFGWVDTTTIAAGVVGLGVGTAYMLQAIAKNEQSKAGCDGDSCSPDAKQDRLDAREYGRIATIGFAAGGALLAAGVTIYLVGGASGGGSERAPTALQAAPLPVAGGFGGVLRGTF